MSKFLRLLRESDPARTSRFTIELKDYNGDVLDAIESSGDSYEAFKGVKELFGIDDDIPGDVGEGSVEYIHGEPGSEVTEVDGVEDNEDDIALKKIGLDATGLNAVKVAGKLATGAGGWGAQKITQNRMNAAYGELMRKVAKKVSNIAKNIT